MRDHDPTSPEKTPSREEVVDALRKFPERGVTNPDDLDRADPEVIEAERRLDAWHAQGERNANESNAPDAKLAWRLDRSTIHVDAGFHDPVYLEEVAYDWLELNDLNDAEAAGLDEMATKVRAKITEIEDILASQKSGSSEQ